MAANYCNGLLWGIVAYDIQLLGRPGRHLVHIGP